MSPFVKEKCSICIVGMCCSDVCEEYKKFIEGYYGIMTNSRTLSNIEYIIECTKNTNLYLDLPISIIYIKPKENWVHVEKNKALKSIKKVKRLWRKMKKNFHAKTA